MRFSVKISLIIINIFSNLFAQDIKLFDKQTRYTGDFVNNLLGGIRQGSVYLGMAQINLSFETEKVGLWSGGQIFINWVSTHGSTPSIDLIGDFQVASNIEAGNHIYIQELWFRQSFTDAEIKIGVQDLNTEFVVSEFSSDFLNSSFGVPSVISDNIPAPIFPLTTLGISGKLKLSSDVSFAAAIYDGMPEPFEQNEYNIKWSLNKKHGLLFFSEVQFASPFSSHKGNFKIGGYYHTQLETFDPELNSYETVFNKNYGIYLISDNIIWESIENNKVGLFIQTVLSPKNINNHYYYFGCGISYSGLFNNDVAGIAVAHAGFSPSYSKSETTIELFYKRYVTHNLFIQPDVQYIINPLGTSNILNNSIVAFFRFGFNF